MTHSQAQGNGQPFVVIQPQDNDQRGNVDHVQATVANVNGGHVVG